MVINRPDEETRKSIREFFGLDSRERDPVPCNTFNALVKIYSLLPDQSKNPFAKYANRPEYTTLFSDGVRDNSEARKKAVPYDSDYLPGVEVGNSSVHSERKSDRSAAAFYDDGVLRTAEMITNELGMSKNSEMMDKVAHDEEGTTVGTIGLCNVHEDLSSINRMLMDESDDPDMLQLLDKDVTMDLACDFGSILDIDKPCDKSLTMEIFESEKCIAGDITKKDSVHGKKRKRVEVNRSILEGEGISQAPKSADTVLSSCPEFVNQNVKCIKDALSKDKKLSEQIALRELTETGGLASTEWERENVGQVSSGQLLDRKRNQLIVSAKAKKTKIKNTKKKKSDKDVESGVGKLVRLEGEAYNNMKSGGGDPVVHGKIRKQVVLGLLSSPSTKEDNERRPKACERLRYTREELLHLGKTAFAPECIQKAAREIGAEIHEKHQISAAFAIADSSILKNKRGGSGSEARKEKKKLKRRKQRAELNRKLGVKRLKLKPIVKPKVVQHCRHYLNGRCHEGEKCKFSHDVVPLTKSKPCCHFARQACMKGDDCPFDHQLSKYPCNNYSDTGFCSRGESCSFSHKIAVKEGSEPSTVPLKSDTSSVAQHDVSKSKWQSNDSVPSTPGKTMLNNLKEVSTTKAIQPAKKPKGLTFFSFGKSQSDNSVLPKDSEFSQQSSYTVEASAQPVIVEGATSELRKSLDRTSVDRLGDNKLPLPPPHGNNSSRNISFGMKLLNDSAKEHLKDTSGSSDYAAGTSTKDSALDFCKIFKGTLTPERDLNLSEMLTGGPTQAKAKGIGVSPSGGPSYDKTDGKSICFKEKGNTNLSDKSKDVQPERPIWSSQTSLSQSPTKIDLPVKTSPSNSHKALQSALAFAAKYSSGFKTGSMAATKENTLNEETSCSGSKKSEPLQASKILQFLHGQGK